MGKTFSVPQSLSETMTHYCPGCTHGIVHRLIAGEIIVYQNRRDCTGGMCRSDIQLFHLR